jgi:hypothetical protein
MIDFFDLATNMGVILVRSFFIVKKEDIRHAQDATTLIPP